MLSLEKCQCYIAGLGDPVRIIYQSETYEMITKNRSIVRRYKIKGNSKRLYIIYWSEVLV